MARARYGFLALAALMLVIPAAAGPSPRAPTIQVTEPAGTTPIGEGNDFATSAWGDPWDMTSTEDVYIWGSSLCHDPDPPYINIGITNGVWHGTVASSSAPVFLVQPGFQAGAVHTGHDGLYRPIDAGRYVRLTFRMKIDYAPAGSIGAGRLRYGDGSFENQGDLNHWSWSRQFQVFADNLWHIYSIDIPAISPGLGNLTWTAGKWMTAVAVETGLAPGATVWFDWFRLSDAGVSQRIAWTGSYAGNATIQLGLGNPTDGFVPVHVYEPGNWQGSYYLPTTINAAPGSYTLHGGLGQAGGQERYTVKATVTDGTGSTTSAAAGPFLVRGAPWGSFTRPAFTAGVDWVTSITNPPDPWDMDVAHSADVNTTVNVQAGATYVNVGGEEFYHGTSVDGGVTCVATGDPELKLRMHGGSIPSATYHWLTFRLWVEGVPDLGAGSVARVSWFDSTWTVCGETNDIRLQTGWNTYSVDLADPNIIEPNGVCLTPWLSQPSWRFFRLDPHEVPQAIPFWLDYIYLAADTVANTTVDLTWQELLPAGAGAKMTLYYDNDLNPDNGKTQIVVGGGHPGTAVLPSLSCPFGQCTYLPAVTGGTLPPLCSGGACRYTWNTSALPDGTYWLYIESSDGYSTIGRYSDTPVIVHHTP